MTFRFEDDYKNAYSQKIYTCTPESFIVLFSSDKLARLFLLKDAKPSPKSKMMKLLTFGIKLVSATTTSSVEWWWLPLFPPKWHWFTHVHCIEKNFVLVVVLVLESTYIIYKRCLIRGVARIFQRGGHHPGIADYIWFIPLLSLVYQRAQSYRPCHGFRRHLDEKANACEITNMICNLKLHS